MKINTELQNKIIKEIEKRNKSNIQFSEKEFYANREEIKADLIQNLASYSDKEYIENLENFDYDEYLQTTVIGSFFKVGDHCEVTEIIKDFISDEDFELYENYELDYLDNSAIQDASCSLT